MTERYIEIPGIKTHELPPLLVHPASALEADLGSVMVEAEDMLAETDAAEDVIEQRKFDLACQLAERYRGASFVELLREKAAALADVVGGVTLEKAVGLRLTFRQPPPIDCFSSQFLFYLDSKVADSAYQTWSHLASSMPALLPPERFHFDVLNVS
jgi:hypothetical protein